MLTPRRHEAIADSRSLMSADRSGSNQRSGRARKDFNHLSFIWLRWLRCPLNHL